MITVWFYARKSNEEKGKEDEEKSVTRQIAHGKAYARKKEWPVPDSDEHVYTDDGISGIEFEDRPGLQRLLAALKPRPKGEVKLIMAEASRLGREQFETGYLLKRLHEAGVEVHYYLTGKKATLERAVEKFTTSAENFANEQWRESISDHTKDGLRRKREAGYATGPAPYGFTNVPVIVNGKRQHSTRETVPEEVAALRRLATLYADDHLSPRKTAHVLNVKGLIAPQPRQRCVACRKSDQKKCEHKIRKWSGPTVRSLLLRPCYREIFGERLWQRIQERFTEPLPNNPDRRPPSRRGLGWSASGEGKYLGTGLYICGDCGGNYIARKTSRNRWVYRCGTYHKRGVAACRNGFNLPKEATDRAVLDSLDQTVLANQFIDQMVNEIWKAEEASKPEADLRKELATVEQELAHYAQAIAQAGPLESLLAEIRVREDRKAHLQFDLKKQTPKPDRGRIKTTIITWRKATQARIALQTILKTSLVFTPLEKDGKCVGAEFRGEGNLSPILGSIGLESHS